jgi:ADP-heptose:LPS heptosyltransferase
LPLEQNTLPDRLDGKRIFINFDQGLGDELFFLRFFDRLRERNPQITYLTQEKIAEIIRRNLPGEQVVTNNQQIDLSGFDHCISIGDLPFLLNMKNENDIPPSVSLSVLPERRAEIKRKLRDFGPAPYFGITWRSGTEQYNKLFKIVPQDALAQALRDVKGTYIALQRGPQPGEIQRFSEHIDQPVHDMTSLNDDLEAMLATLAILDDYICVSNTNVHLREAVGKPSRVLVPFPAEYRWMVKEGESLWFPGTAVYRQAANFSWHDALTALSDELSAQWQQN